MYLYIENEIKTRWDGLFMRWCQTSVLILVSLHGIVVVLWCKVDPGSIERSRICLKGKWGGGVAFRDYLLLYAVRNWEGCGSKMTFFSKIFQPKEGGGLHPRNFPSKYVYAVLLTPSKSDRNKGAVGV